MNTVVIKRIHGFAVAQFFKKPEVLVLCKFVVKCRILQMAVKVAMLPSARSVVA